jgi:hypothetical protein
MWFQRKLILVKSHLIYYKVCSLSCLRIRELVFCAIYQSLVTAGIGRRTAARKTMKWYHAQGQSEKTAGMNAPTFSAMGGILAMS